MSGELPEGWAWVPLEDLVRADAPLCYGVVQPGEDESDGVPLVRVCDLVAGTVRTGELRRIPREVATEYRRSTLQGGELLVSLVGTVGRTAVVPSSLRGANVARAIARVALREEAMPRWVKGWLDTPYMQEALVRDAREVARKTLNLGQLATVQVPVAPLNEQRRIVAKVEALMARSRRAKEALAAIPPLLDQLRQSILAAAFRGDLTADWRAQHPDVEPATELLQRIRTERRRRWEQAELAKMKAKGKAPGDDRWKERYEEQEAVDESELAELPEGWCWATWAAVGYCQNGRAFPSEEYTVVGTRLLRPGNLHVNGWVEWTAENTRCMPSTWAERYPDYLVHSNELVMNLTAQSLKDQFLGRVCMTREGEACLLNQRLARITPIILNKRWCLYWMKSPQFRRFVDSLNTGSLIQHMFTSQVDAHALPVPPLAEQEEMVRVTDKLVDRYASVLDAMGEHEDHLQSLDSSILAKAFRGELVPQDPDDEPASVLLERIRAKKSDESRKKRARTR